MLCSFSVVKQSHLHNYNTSVVQLPTLKPKNEKPQTTKSCFFKIYMNANFMPNGPLKIFVMPQELCEDREQRETRSSNEEFFFILL